MAIGAFENAGNGVNSSHVRVFSDPNSPPPPEIVTDAPMAAHTMIMESEHKYAPKTNEVWVVDFPNTIC